MIYTETKPNKKPPTVPTLSHFNNSNSNNPNYRIITIIVVRIPPTPLKIYNKTTATPPTQKKTLKLTKDNNLSTI